jgi:hypothetical protein
MTAKTLKPARQKYAAEQAVLLLLFLGWFATAAAGACLPYISWSAESGAGPDIHIHTYHAGNADDIADACCVLSSDARHPLLLAQWGSSAEPKPVALPAPAVPQHVDAAPASWRVPLNIDTAVSHPPFYLLYSRLLIPSYS